MTPWQRRARLAIGLFGILFAAIVTFAIRDREAPAKAPSVDRADPNAVVETTGALLTQVRGRKENFTIRAERQLTYQGGRSVLTGVRVGVDERAGRNFVITGHEAEVGPDQSTVTLTGDVRLTASDGLTARAGSASYSDGEGVVRAPGPVEFARARLSGAGVGMSYDKNRDVLWLLDKALIRLAPDAAGTGGIEVTAGAAGLARQEKYLRFERGVTMLRSGQVVESDQALAFLSDDEQRIEAIELRGTSRIRAPGDAAGMLQAMNARDINLAYGPEAALLQHATLAGGAVVQLAGGGGAPGRRIAGEAIDIALAPDGRTITALDARDRVQLDLPAEPDAPARTIRATSLRSTGNPAGGLTSARFGETVEYREAAKSASTPARVVRARDLDLAVKPGFAAVEEARFSGGARFEEGALRATAADVRYLVTRGVLELAGAVGPASPHVADEQITVDATGIELTLDGRRLNAAGQVRSVLQPAKKPAAGSGEAGGATRVPKMLKPDQPVYVTAERLAYDGAASRAVYTGGTRLWQGETAIQAETIALDDRTGDLSASGGVRSTVILEQTSQGREATEQVPTRASGDDLRYEDGPRRATYTKTAHVNGPQGDLSADRIELYLAESGRAADRVEAFQGVTLRTDQRVATGERLTYIAGDERYVMAGAPVKIVEECRETTGKSLTFFKSTDRILVDGNEESRTQTKSGGKCPEPRQE